MEIALIGDKKTKAFLMQLVASSGSNKKFQDKMFPATHALHVG